MIRRSCVYVQAFPIWTPPPADTQGREQSRAKRVPFVPPDFRNPVCQKKSRAAGPALDAEKYQKLESVYQKSALPPPPFRILQTTKDSTHQHSGASTETHALWARPRAAQLLPEHSTEKFPGVVSRKRWDAGNHPNDRCRQQRPGRLDPSISLRLEKL